ncbi:hypothetical protein NGRA_3448 [Nosema granulosis]|uniref:Uncharacterized protein n=1 Tax=Nosema granulosis TaxID=83296 RepID=A0A9P6KX61_9MICR|nr:hypothetical protein NGRA_3448 [Nosema granulosis]
MAGFELENDIEEYLKQNELNNQLVFDSKIILSSLEAVNKEIAPVENNIDALNAKLKAFDFIDYISKHKLSSPDLKTVNRILQDLKLFKNDLTKDYLRRWKKVYDNVVEIGNDLVANTIENQIESFYSNDDFVSFVVILETKEEVMEMVVEKRRRVCENKIRHYEGDKEVFYRMLINQEMFLWSMLFPENLNMILSRLVDLHLPLGYSKLERFVYAILCVYFDSSTFDCATFDCPCPFLDENGTLKFMNNYSKMDSSVHDWFYNALVFKASKEYFKDGVIDL